MAEESDQKQQLFTSVWHTVNQIAQQEAQSVGKEVSETFVASLADVVLSQIETMATDLEAFSSHSKRSVISMEDVKLCARRNDSLYELISENAKEIAEESNSNRRKKKANDA